MNPIAFTIGPLPIHWYGILLATGLLAGALVAYLRAPKFDIDPDHVLNLAIIGAPLGIIGGRAYYVIFNWGYYSRYPGEIIATWHGGMAIHGVILAALLVAGIYCWKKKISFWKLTDLLVPSLALGQAIGRWGNFVNQEAYGRPTNLPWGMQIAGAKRHPTFLYESLWDLGVFIFLLWFSERKKVGTGQVFGAYLITYSIGRFIVESFRTDSLMLGPFRAAQVVSVIFVIVGSIIIYRSRSAEREG